jgi:hypothetical protein
MRSFERDGIISEISAGGRAVNENDRTVFDPTETRERD